MAELHVISRVSPGTPSSNLYIILHSARHNQNMCVASIFAHHIANMFVMCVCLPIYMCHKMHAHDETEKKTYTWYL